MMKCQFFCVFVCGWVVLFVVVVVDFDVVLQYESCMVMVDGVMCMMLYCEWMVWCDGYVWVECVLFVVVVGGEYGDDYGYDYDYDVGCCVGVKLVVVYVGYKYFNFQVVVWYVMYDGKLVCIEYVDVVNWMVVSVLLVEYEIIGFDGLWDNVYYVMLLLQLKWFVVVKCGDVFGIVWYEQVVDMFGVCGVNWILWSEWLQVLLLVEYCSVDGCVMCKLMLMLVLVVWWDMLLWQMFVGYLCKEYVDYFD